MYADYDVPYYSLGFNGKTRDENEGILGSFSTSGGNFAWIQPTGENGYNGYLAGAWSDKTPAGGEMINLYGLPTEGERLTVSFDLMGESDGKGGVSTTVWSLRIRASGSGEKWLIKIKNDGTLVFLDTVVLGKLSAEEFRNLTLTVEMGETSGTIVVTACFDYGETHTKTLQDTFVTALSDIARVQIYGAKPTVGTASPNTYFDNFYIIAK